MYMDQCRDLLTCVTSRKQHSVSGQDGYKAMALGVKHSART